MNALETNGQCAQVRNKDHLFEVRTSETTGAGHCSTIIEMYSCALPCNGR